MNPTLQPVTSTAPRFAVNAALAYRSRVAAFCISLMFVTMSAVAQDREQPLYKSEYRIVDIHGHAAVPDERALEINTKLLNNVGVDVFNILLFDPSGWKYAGGWSPANLVGWLEICNKHPDQVCVFGTVDFGRDADDDAFVERVVGELHHAAARGMQGVKIWKNLGMHHRDKAGKLLKIDDPRFDPIWTTCGELKLPVLIHAADSREYWYPQTYTTFQYNGKSTALYYQHAEVPSWEELIRQRNRIVEKHPQTIFIGAHFGSLSSNFDELARTLDRYPNFHVECGARLRFMYRYSPAAVRDFFVKYQDRILFGTDSWIVRPREMTDSERIKEWAAKRARKYSRYFEYLETDHVGLVEPAGYESDWLRLTGVKLPPEVLEKVYHANAERLISVETTPHAKPE